jgi:hypothetical protein
MAKDNQKPNSNDLLFKNKKKEKCIFIFFTFIYFNKTNSYTVFYKHQINSFSKLNDSSILKLCINLRYTFNILIVLIIV